MKHESLAQILAVVLGAAGVGTVGMELLRREISRGISRSGRWIGPTGYGLPGLVFGMIILDGAAGLPRVFGVLGCVGYVVTGILLFARAGDRRPNPETEAVDR